MPHEKCSIITIAGDLGSGKSTVAEMISCELSFERYSTGDVQRTLAKERGVTSLELNVLAETKKDIDSLIDSALTSLAESGKRLVVDSRLAWHFIPHSFKVYLSVDPLIASQRIQNDSIRGTVEEYASVEEAYEKISQRRSSEEKRFNTLYDVDIANYNNYDLIIDTSYSTPSTVASVLIECFRQWVESIPHIPMWISPRRMIPTQDIRGIRDERTEPLIRSMANTGFNPNCPIEVVVVERYFYIINGHKRVSSALRNNIEFCPCVLLASDDELIYDNITARQYITDSCSPSRIYDWEDAHDFRFASYPGGLM